MELTPRSFPRAALAAWSASRQRPPRSARNPLGGPCGGGGHGGRHGSDRQRCAAVRPGIEGRRARVRFVFAGRHSRSAVRLMRAPGRVGGRRPRRFVRIRLGRLSAARVHGVPKSACSRSLRARRWARHGPRPNRHHFGSPDRSDASDGARAAGAAYQRLSSRGSSFARPTEAHARTPNPGALATGCPPRLKEGAARNPHRPRASSQSRPPWGLKPLLTCVHARTHARTQPHDDLAGLMVRS